MGPDGAITPVTLTALRTLLETHSVTEMEPVIPSVPVRVVPKASDLLLGTRSVMEMELATPSVHPMARH